MMSLPRTSHGSINRNHPLFQAFVLGCFTLIICLIIGGLWFSAKETISQRQLEDIEQQLVQIFPADSYDNAISEKEYHLLIDGKTVRYYRATLNNQPSGVIIFCSSKGYSGPIDMLLGIRADGSITGVRVVNHAETPGLGDKIELSRSDWILSFNDKSLDNTAEGAWRVKKDGGSFDAFTGATITPRAVVKGVHDTLQLFSNHKTEFLGQ